MLCWDTPDLTSRCTQVVVGELLCTLGHIRSVCMMSDLHVEYVLHRRNDLKSAGSTEGEHSIERNQGNLLMLILCHRSSTHIWQRKLRLYYKVPHHGNWNIVKQLAECVGWAIYQGSLVDA